jgi:hypothetical protein
MFSLKKISSSFLGLLFALFVALGACTAPAAIAATTNFAISQPGVVVIPLHISGQYTATTANVVKFAMPFKCRLVGVGATARASGGTSPTLTVDLKDDTVSALSAAISITAGTYSEGTIANAVVADESVMTVDLTIGGTSPTWNDITIFITAVRE